MKKVITISTIIFASCGDLQDFKKDNALSQGPKLDVVSDGENGKNGKSCSVEQLEVGAKMVCEDGTEAIIVNGKNGKNGQDGKQGQHGQDGKDGEIGIAGVDGQDGQDGQSVTYDYPIVEDEDGIELGRLAYIDNLGAHAVLMEDGLRAKISNNGYPETFPTYFENEDCTGERRVLVKNGFFGNFGLDNFVGDGSFWRLDSRIIGGFHYGSREDGDGICDSDPGGYITSSTYSMITGVELDITVPFGMWPRVR